MRQAAWGAHRRLAVVLGLWVVFQSLTGLVLLFRDPIEHWAHPGLTHHGHGDLGAAAALDAVRGKYPDEEVGPLATPAVSDGVYVVEVGEREVYVDPARAHINGERDHDAGFVALVERLHRRFLFDSLVGLSGVRLVATAGLAWLVLSLTGLTTAAAGRVSQWWRRGQETGRWWRSLPPGARRTPHILHRTIGFVVVAPMVVVVVTGIRLAVPAGSDRMWAAVTGSGHGRLDRAPQEVRHTSEDRGGDPMDATQLLAALHRKYPDGQVARLLMPAHEDRRAPVLAGVSVGLDPGRGQHDYGGNTVVFLDQFTGDTLWEGRPDALPAARQAALLWSRPLHTGSFAGSPGELLWGWLAVAIVALGSAGYVTRRMRTMEERMDQRQGQRRLRRRRALAQRQRTLAATAARTARDRRHTSRRLRRRRRIQARIHSRMGIPAPAPPGATDREAGIDLTDDTEVSPVEVGAVEVGAVEVGAVEIDLTDTATEIDLTDVVEIDLTDGGLDESTITLESGDTLESGIVGLPPPD